MERIVAIGEAADVLGVSIATLRRWEAAGKLAAEHTAGGHRRYGRRFFEFRRQLDDKARLYGASVVVADRWFPSSKTCSCCGSVKAELDVSQRVFRCGPCG